MRLFDGLLTIDSICTTIFCLFVDIPFVLEIAASLTAFTHPNHIVNLCSWGFTHLSPCCNANYFGYKRMNRNG